MRSTARCTKCNHPRIWRVERVGVKDPRYSNGLNVPLGAVGRHGLENPGDRFMTGYDAGHVDAYVCAACGYTELYWQGFQALRHNPQDGVHLIEAPNAGPCR